MLIWIVMERRVINRMMPLYGSLYFPLQYRHNRQKKKALAISRKCLILKVDQPGLEPGTSRL